MIGFHHPWRPLGDPLRRAQLLCLGGRGPHLGLVDDLLEHELGLSRNVLWLRLGRNPGR